jgi:hypothetical protein
MSTQMGFAGSMHSADISQAPPLVVVELAVSVSLPLALIDPAVVGPPVGSLVASVPVADTDEFDPSASPSHSASSSTDFLPPHGE